MNPICTCNTRNLRRPCQGLQIVVASYPRVPFGHPGLKSIQTYPIRYISPVFVAFVLVVSSSNEHAFAQSESISPNPDVQLRFQEMLNMAESSDPEVIARYMKLFDEIWQILDDDQVKFLRQWIHCYHTFVRNHERKSDLTIALLYMPAKHISGIEFTRWNYVCAFAPLLDSPDRQLAELAAEVLNDADRAPSGLFDFDVYVPFLEQELETKGTLPRGLLEYLLGRSRADALLAIAAADPSLVEDPDVRLEIADPEARRAANTKIILTRSQSVEDAQLKLEELSMRTEWWARLFAAELIREVPELRTRSILSNLALSSDPLVQDVLADMN